MTVTADFDTLQRVIADELGNRMDLLNDLPETGILGTTSPIIRAIHSAIAKWEREPFYFNEAYSYPLFTTTVGTESYASADIISTPNIWYLHILIGGNRFDLRRRSWGYIEELSVNPLAYGQPAEWAYFADQIRLYPIPDAIYQVRASRTERVAALVADGDSNCWTTDAYDLIRCEAKLILARDTLHDPQIVGECEMAIYGNPVSPRDTGYLGALRAETMRRSRSRIKPTQF